MEQGSEVARHTQVGVAQAVDLAGGNELPEPVVDLVQDESIEGDAGLQQLMEVFDRQTGHDAAPQGPGCCNGTPHA